MTETQDEMLPPLPDSAVPIHAAVAAMDADG